MLGRFLEISITTAEILESLAFYESLGFQQIPVGEVWTHPYAVVTDGRLFLGLHQRPAPSLSLTYVHPNLAADLERLRNLGVTFHQEQLASDAFNHAAFTDPDGLHVNVLEARTFSPPALSANFGSACGYFAELGIPTRKFEAGRDFWESLGFVAMETSEGDVPRMSLTSDHINLGLFRTRALRQAVLVFEDAHMASKIAELRDRGFVLSDDMPDAFGADNNTVLEAPEGTRLLLLQVDD